MTDPMPEPDVVDEDVDLADSDPQPEPDVEQANEDGAS